MRVSVNVSVRDTVGGPRSSIEGSFLVLKWHRISTDESVVHTVDSMPCQLPINSRHASRRARRHIGEFTVVGR